MPTPARKLSLATCSLLVAGILLLLAGCSSSSKNSSSNSGGSLTVASNSNALIGAGSTFVYPVMTRWISDFHSSSNTLINYQSIGSGGGIQQLKKGLVDFGASDAALDDEQLKTMPAVIQVPESAGPVCITYNLPDLQRPLKLSAQTLAGIYLGTIKTWQDPAIARDNTGLKLPSEPVIVVHRSDGSGTTNIFTTYLKTVSPEWAKVGAGISINWPVGVGGKGSEGVTGLVKQSPGAIGYVELTYAMQNNLPVALIRNKAGQWIKPTAEAATASVAAFSDQLGKDVRAPIVDPPSSATDAYPISGLTFLLIPKDGQDQAKRTQLKQFVTYILANGQKDASELHYASLPKSLEDTDRNLLNQMQAGGKPLS